MNESLRTLAIRLMVAVGWVATLMLTAAANGTADLTDSALLAGILALVAVAVVALILVRRRRGRNAVRTTTIEDE
jgi:membrane protein implicated in regulation of membrane protease activity